MIETRHFEPGESTDPITAWMDEARFIVSLIERFPDDWITKDHHAVKKEKKQTLVFL